MSIKALLSSVNLSQKSLSIVLRTPNIGMIKEKKNIPYKENSLCKSPEVGMQMRFRPRTTQGPAQGHTMMWRKKRTQSLDLLTFTQGLSPEASWNGRNGTGLAVKQT